MAMKRPILSGGAGELFLSVSGHDDPFRIPLNDIQITISDEITPIMADFQRQPTTVKVGKREVRIKATVPKLIDGVPFWELFGLSSTSRDMVRKPKTETITIDATNGNTLSPDSGYDIDPDSLVVIDYEGDTPTGYQYDRVSSPSQSGEYSYNETTHALGWHSADDGKKVLVRYIQTLSGTAYAVGKGLRRCATLKAAFPILDEFGCPADFTRYIAVEAPRVVPTSDLVIQGTEGETSLDIEFIAMADPNGISLYISTREDGS